MLGSVSKTKIKLKFVTPNLSFSQDVSMAQDVLIELYLQQCPQNFCRQLTSSYVKQNPSFSQKLASSFFLQVNTYWTSNIPGFVLIPPTFLKCRIVRWQIHKTITIMCGVMSKASYRRRIVDLGRFARLLRVSIFLSVKWVQ